jgi:hypothetical protein
MLSLRRLRQGICPGTGTDEIWAKIGGYVRANLAFRAWPNDRAFAGGRLDLNNQPLNTDETRSSTFMNRASAFVDARIKHVL